MARSKADANTSDRMDYIVIEMKTTTAHTVFH